MNTLAEIANKYTDLTDKNSKHSYCDIYDVIFKDIISNKLTILEIGVGLGGSILMWLDYFRNADVYGIDICEIPESLKNDNRYNHYKIDAYTKKAVDILPNFDIIIDDGPHTQESFHQLLSLYSYKVKKNGYLIIEDVDYYNHNISKIINNFDNSFETNIFDLRYRKNVGDDIAIIGKKIK